MVSEVINAYIAMMTSLGMSFDSARRFLEQSPVKSAIRLSVKSRLKPSLLSSAGAAP